MWLVVVCSVVMAMAVRTVGCVVCLSVTRPHPFCFGRGWRQRSDTPWPWLLQCVSVFFPVC